MKETVFDFCRNYACSVLDERVDRSVVGKCADKRLTYEPGVGRARDDPFIGNDDGVCRLGTVKHFDVFLDLIEGVIDPEYSVIVSEHYGDCIANVLC